MFCKVAFKIQKQTNQIPNDLLMGRKASSSSSRGGYEPNNQVQVGPSPGRQLPTTIYENKKSQALRLSLKFN